MGSLVFRIAGSGDDTSYINPFIYATFETSSSATVSVEGQQSGYSGSLDTTGASFLADGIPKYDNTSPLRGSYSVNFYKEADLDEKKGFIDFGTPASRTEWQTLFTSSFSVSTWIYPTEAQSGWQYSGIFWLKDPIRADYNWMFILDTDSLGFYQASGDGGGSGGWQWFASSSVPIVQNQWNHIVWVASGTVGSSTLSAYINNHNLGAAPTTFNQGMNTAYTVGVGNWFPDGNYELQGRMDELSVWDIALSADQVSELYNGGSATNALTALTSSS